VVFRAKEIASAINIGARTSPETFEFAANFWYCEDRPDRTQRIVQLPSAEKNGVYGQDPQFQDAAKGDLQTKAESPAGKFGPRRTK